jgi:IS1 transposase
MLLLTKNASHASGGQQHAMVIRDVCPRCQSPKHKKNGHIHNGKQNHQCHDCGRQLVTCHGDVMIQQLAVEADEMSSFVHKKANKQWIWIAMDAKARQVMAFHVGDRSRGNDK